MGFIILPLKGYLARTYLKETCTMQPSYNINILVIEDNPGDQFLLTELLRSSGFNEGLTSVSASMREALILLENNKVDIVLLDLTLPDSSGIESFLALEKYIQIVPVVILSGMSDMKVALDAINLGAQDYLIKGDFDEKLLAKTILYSIERSNSLRALKESNEKYDFISKATNDMIWDWDLVTGVVNRSKEGWKKILRVVDGEVPTHQRGWDDRVHPDDREKVAAVHNAVLSDKSDFFEIECRVQRDDRTYAYIHDRGFVIRNRQDNAIKLIGATRDITERKEAEIMLANSEKRFRALIENSSDGLIIVDASGVTLDISPSAQRILSYTRQEYMNTDSFSHIHASHKEMVSQALINLVKVADASTSIEYMYQRGTGDYTWIEATFHNQMHEPVVNAIVINFRDISERKMVEEELKKLSHIARETNNAVVITDAEGHIQWVNEAFTRITEYALSEVIGKTPGNCLQGAETSPVTVRYMRIKLANERSFDCDLINYTKSGEKYWIRIQCQPQFDNQNKLIGWFALTTNITNEKEADNNIKISEEKYRSLFEFNPNAIIVWDPADFRVLEVNNRAVQEYGYSKEEFLKITVLHFRPASDYTRMRALAKAFFENNALTYTVTREHVHKNGEILPMNYVSRCISYKGKIAILSMGTNMKEKLKLEKELEDERTQKQFEITEAVITAQEKERKEIGEELHDNVNQILAGSLLYLGLSRKDIAREIPFLKETEKLINAAIFELRNLSHSLIPPRLPESELSEALDNIIKITSVTGIAVYKEFVHIEKELISPKLQLSIYRIVQEQFGNILKHAQAKNIYLSVVNQNNVVQLSIKDDGKGFDTRIKSKGVGLMNIKARASLFDSKVAIRSAVGRGCELKISFIQTERTASSAAVNDDE